ncbi:MAG: phytoene/squalene synthase family protein [Deltaproteobacteria bacterium]|nr:MAG: phytoene/squalene synthase family protein [Deltaproteobacteria bacterium]
MGGARDNLPVPLEAVAEADTTVLEASRLVLQTHARSFSWGALFLPPEARDDAALLYAWCRHVDDLVDEATDRDEAAAALSATRAMLRGDGEADPLTAAFLAMAARRVLPLRAAEELVAGMETDLGEVRMADDAAFLLYCYRAAGTVGLLMCGILGVEEPEAAPFAVDLGIAMQITNICRDVKEDAARGRVYLPAARLVAHGVTPEEVLAGRADPVGVSAVVRELLAVAERYYASGEAGMRYIPRRTRLAIRVAARVYRAIGVRLLRQGANPLVGRTVVPWWAKLRETVRAVFAEAGARATLPDHDAPLHRLLPELPGVAAGELRPPGAAP